MLPILPERSPAPSLHSAGPLASSGGPVPAATPLAAAAGAGTGADFAGLLDAALPRGEDSAGNDPAPVTPVALAPSPAPTGKSLPPPGATLPPTASEAALGQIAPQTPPQATSAPITPAPVAIPPERGAVIPATPRAAGRGAAVPGEPLAVSLAPAPTPTDGAAADAGVTQADATLASQTADPADALPAPATAAMTPAPQAPGSDPLATPGAMVPGDAALTTPLDPPPSAEAAALAVLTQPALAAPTPPARAAALPLVRGGIAPLPARVALPATSTAAPALPPLPPLPAEDSPAPSPASAHPAEGLPEALAQPAQPAAPSPAAPPLLAAAASPPAQPPALAAPTDTPAPPAPTIADTIAQADTLREALRAQRPELTLRHAEFGAVSLRLEATGAESWRAVLAARDPGFVPAVHAALAERAVAAASAADSAGGFLSQNGTSDQRYGASPNGGQGGHSPHFGQSGARDGEAAPDHRRPSTAATLAGRDRQDSEGPGSSPARQSRGLFA